MNDWQPIETAPKDGRDILLTIGGRVMIGQWNECTHFGQFRTGPGWQIYYNEEDDFYSFGIDNPSHWMPLPNPTK